MKNVTILFLPLLVLLVAVGSVRASPISRQVGLSNDVQVVSVNGTQACQVGGKLYQPYDDLPTDDPCEYCTCQPPGFACEVVKCEYKAGCRSLQRSGLCCPEYICDCEYEGEIYQNGDRIKKTSNACEDCYCITGDVVCSVINCSPPSDKNCTETPVEGECCPTYECDTPPPPKEKDPSDGDDDSSSETVVELPEESQDTQPEKDSDSDVKDETTSDAGYETNEIDAVITKEDVKQTEALVEVSEAPSEELYTENSLFVQKLQTEAELVEEYGTSVSSLSDATEVPVVEEVSVSEQTQSTAIDEEFESKTTERDIPEEYLHESTEGSFTDESQSEMTESFISEGEFLTEATERLVVDDRYDNGAAVEFVTEKESLIEETERTVTDEQYESEVTEKSDTELYLNNPTEIASLDQSVTETTERAAVESLVNELTERSVLYEEFESATTEVSATEKEFEMETTERSAINEYSEKEVKEIYADEGESIQLTERVESVTEENTSTTPTEKSALITEFESDQADQSTPDEYLLNESTIKSVTDDESLDELMLRSDPELVTELTTETDDTSDKDERFSNLEENELTTEYSKTTEKIGDEYWTSLLDSDSNTEDSIRLRDDLGTAVTEEQYETTSLSEDDILGAASEQKEIKLRREVLLETDTFKAETTTVEYLRSLDEETTEVQFQDNIETTTSFDDRSEVDYKLFKSDIEDTNEIIDEESFISYETTEEITTSKVDDSNIEDNQINSDGHKSSNLTSEMLTTHIPVKERMEDKDDYWSNMMIGKNNPLDVMKAISTHSKLPDNNDLANEEAVTENEIAVEDSTTLLRNDLEFSQDETSTTEQIQDEETVTEELEPELQFLDSNIKAETNEITEAESTTESENDVTSELQDDDKLRFNLNEQVTASDIDTTTQLDDFVTEVPSDRPELKEKDKLSDEENTATVVNEDLVREYVISRSEDITTVGTIEDGSVKEDESAKKEVPEKIEANSDITKIEILSAAGGIQKSQNMDSASNNEDLASHHDDEDDESSSKKVIMLRESNVHTFENILSNGSITKIQTHSNDEGLEKSKRISHQFQHLARKYGLRPLTRKTFRDDIKNRRITRQRTKKSLFKRQ